MCARFSMGGDGAVEPTVGSVVLEHTFKGGTDAKHAEEGK